MRRNALCLSVSLFLTLASSGCATSNKLSAKKAAAPAPSAMGLADLYVPATAIETETTPEYTAYASPVDAKPSMPQVVAADPITGVALQAHADTGSRLHTVSRKETLYSLARQYYGDHRRWKDIFEANRSIVLDPNRIFVGQHLAIP